MPALSTTHRDRQPGRLNYLDWLRVVAVLGVFLIHRTAQLSRLFGIKMSRLSLKPTGSFIP